MTARLVIPLRLVGILVFIVLICMLISSYNVHPFTRLVSTHKYFIYEQYFELGEEFKLRESCVASLL